MKVLIIAASLTVALATSINIEARGKIPSSHDTEVLSIDMAHERIISNYKLNAVPEFPYELVVIEAQYFVKHYTREKKTKVCGSKLNYWPGYKRLV